MNVNSSNTLNNPNVVDIKTLDDTQLSDKLKIAKETNNYEDMIIFAGEMKRRLSPDINEIDEKQKQIEEKIKNGNMTTDQLKDYFLNDIKTFKSETKSSFDTVDAYKNKQISDLQKQLEGSITELPNLTEYFSLERRRLVKMTEKIKEFKNDKSNYPKNFLIYAMAMTNTKIFGTREKIKRGYIGMLWKRKNDDIKQQLGILDNKLQPNTGDSKNRQLLKDLLKKEVVEAKKSYVEGVSKSIGV